MRVAIAAIQANGSERIAKKASSAVLDVGNNKKHPESLRQLAFQVSMAVLEAGGDHEVASAVTVCIMSSEEAGSVMMHAPKQSRVSKKKANRPQSSSKISKRDANQEDDYSVTPSISTKREHLKKKEVELDEKASALEKAERLNTLKERDLRQRLEELNTAEAALLQNANIDRAVQDRMVQFELSKDGEVADEEIGVVASKSSGSVERKGYSSDKYLARAPAEGKDVGEVTNIILKPPRAGDQPLSSATVQQKSKLTIYSEQRHKYKFYRQIRSS